MRRTAAFANHAAEQRARPIAVFAIFGCNRSIRSSTAGAAQFVAPRQQTLRVIYPLRSWRDRCPRATRRACSTASMASLIEHGEHAVEDELAERGVFRSAPARSLSTYSRSSRARIASEETRLDEPLLRERRPVARVVEQSLEHRSRHGVVHVVADEIHQLERPHAESAELFHRPVDRRRNRRCPPRGGESTRRRTAARLDSR